MNYLDFRHIPWWVVVKSIKVGSVLIMGGWIVQSHITGVAQLDRPSWGDTRLGYLRAINRGILLYVKLLAIAWPLAIGGSIELYRYLTKYYQFKQAQKAFLQEVHKAPIPTLAAARKKDIHQYMDVGSGEASLLKDMAASHMVVDSERDQKRTLNYILGLAVGLWLGKFMYSTFRK